MTVGKDPEALKIVGIDSLLMEQLSGLDQTPVEINTQGFLDVMILQWSAFKNAPNDHNNNPHKLNIINRRTFKDKYYISHPDLFSIYRLPELHATVKLTSISLHMFMKLDFAIKTIKIMGISKSKEDNVAIN